MNGAMIATPTPAPHWGSDAAPDGAALSPSQITSYLNCSAAWHYKYRLNCPETKTGALALGRAVHAAIAASLIHSATTDNDYDAADYRIEARAACAVELLTAELREDEDAAALCDKAAEMAEAFGVQHTTILPAMIDGRPAVELQLLGNVAGVPVRGIADCVTESGCIIDFKTSSRSPSGVSNAHRIQLTTYAELTGCGQAKIVTITKAVSPKVIEQTFPILPSDREHVRQLFPIVADAMAQGFAIPNRTSTFCSRKYCSFWRQCQQDYGGTVAG